MLHALADIVAEVVAPLLGRVRRYERPMWIVLIALLCALAIAAAVRFGINGD